MSHPVEDVRRQHAVAVLANQVQSASNWGQPCRAYHVLVRPNSAAAAALSALQTRALRLEPALLAVPEQALHANLVWLLPVQEEFDHPKDELWQRHCPQWIATLADAASRTSSFLLTFRHLAVTNTSVITVADQPNLLSTVRRELAAEAEFRIDVDVSELLVIKERVYPCLDYEILHRIPLDRAQAGRKAAGCLGTGEY